MRNIVWGIVLAATSGLVYAAQPDAANATMAGFDLLRQTTVHCYDSERTLAGCVAALNTLLAAGKPRTQLFPYPPDPGRTMWAEVAQESGRSAAGQAAEELERNRVLASLWSRHFEEAAIRKSARKVDFARALLVARNAIPDFGERGASLVASALDAYAASAMDGAPTANQPQGVGR